MPLAYKKWGLQDIDTIIDHASIGKPLPVPVILEPTSYTLIEVSHLLEV